MTPWTSPQIVEISMNAEIGSYQDDAERPEEWPPFVEPARDHDRDREAAFAASQS